MDNVHPKILLVEDEPDVCSALQSFLGRRGLVVTTTASGLEALSLISIAKPDLILLDLTINDLNGIEVLKRLRQTDKATKVIIITGQMCLQQEIDGIAALGIEGFFNKPLVLSHLGELINRALGKEFVRFEATRTSVAAAKVPDSKVRHKILNLLGIIRNKCENYVLGIQDGIFKNKTDEEKVKIAVDTMSDVIHKVDELSRINGRLKQK